MQQRADKGDSVLAFKLRKAPAQLLLMRGAANLRRGGLLFDGDEEPGTRARHTSLRSGAQPRRIRAGNLAGGDGRAELRLRAAAGEGRAVAHGCRGLGLWAWGVIADGQHGRMRLSPTA